MPSETIYRVNKENPIASDSILGSKEICRKIFFLYWANIKQKGCGAIGSAVAQKLAQEEAKISK